MQRVVQNIVILIPALIFHSTHRHFGKGFNFNSSRIAARRITSRSIQPHLREIFGINSCKMETKAQSEEALPYQYRWPRPSVTSDNIILTVENGEPFVLLIKRGNPPFQGNWALPGGFLDPDETLETCAARELQEETGLTDIPLVQVGAFGDPGRDPRGHTVTIAYISCVPSKDCGAKAADDAVDEGWFPLSGLPTLAFDHIKIIEHAWARCTVTLVDGNTQISEKGSGTVLHTYLGDCVGQLEAINPSIC